jgi:FkbM family methyltransferase
MVESMSIVLFGAGAAGGYVLKHLRSQGTDPVAIVDTRAAKWGTDLMGIRIMDPDSAQHKFPDAEWVACAISRPAATEIRAQLLAMGVKTKPLWECLDVCHGLPSEHGWLALLGQVNEQETWDVLQDQKWFRTTPDYDAQRPPSDCKDIYFPDFITKRIDEHFVDCGAADGDTVKAFMERWDQWRSITVFEPDADNFDKLYASIHTTPNIWAHRRAVSDSEGWMNFTANADYSSHLAKEGRGSVRVSTLDSMNLDRPTYIKMDIEGAELEALWGVRQLIREHSPVLAICAYHTSDHLWQIPLLIHALQPDYKLYLRRYAEGAFELVWYAVPPGRVILDSQRLMMHKLAVGENE